MDIDLSGPPDLTTLHSAVVKLVQGHQDHERRILESERVRLELQAQHAEFAASLGALGEQIELLHSGKLAAILSEQQATRDALALKASTDELEAVLSQQRSVADARRARRRVPADLPRHGAGAVGRLLWRRRRRRRARPDGAAA